MKTFLVITLMLYLSGLLTVVAYHLNRAPALEKASRWLVTAGLLVHAGALAERVVSTGHAPMASMFETLLFYSFSTVLVSVIVIYRYRERVTEIITLPVAALALVFAYFNYKPGGPLTLVLRTRWFETHVTASFAAYAFFTLAFSAALLNLLYGARGGR
jgi:ABC-type transport system involved in cytochrome c biogenesis permease subunit